MRDAPEYREAQPKPPSYGGRHVVDDGMVAAGEPLIAAATSQQRLKRRRQHRIVLRAGTNGRKDVARRLLARAAGERPRQARRAGAASLGTSAMPASTETNAAIARQSTL